MSDLFKYLSHSCPEHSYYNKYDAIVVEINKNTLCGRKYGTICDNMYANVRDDDDYICSNKRIYYDDEVLLESNYRIAMLYETKFNTTKMPEINKHDIEINDITRGNTRYEFYNDYKDSIDIVYIYGKKEISVHVARDTVTIYIGLHIIIINTLTKQYTNKIYRPLDSSDDAYICAPL